VLFALLTSLIACGGEDAPVVPLPVASDKGDDEQTPQEPFTAEGADRVAEGVDQPEQIDPFTGEVVDPGDCVTNESFFVQSIWVPVLSKNCIVCHNPLGAAKATSFVLRDAYQTGFLAYNLDVLKEVATYQKNGKSLILLKALGEASHGGGPRLQPDSLEFAALVELLKRLETPVECDEQSDVHPIFDDVILSDAEATLRKTRMALTGSIPSDDEVAMVQELGGGALAQILDTIMTEDAFYERLKEMFNDVFLTNAYAQGVAAVQLLKDADYPERNWWKTCDTTKHPQCLTPEFKDLALELTNWSVAQAPLELVTYLVRNELPFTELLTANYMMVNPFSAKVYGADDVIFNNPLDFTEFKPATIMVMRDGEEVGIPHAGVLTSPMWLNRYPTTDTNVNRHRSRMTYLQFLATDILKLAERAIDQAEITAHNPTMNETACSICHATVDPVAGAFQNWNAAGRYKPPESGWHESMRPPGFGYETIKNQEAGSSLSWLAERITGDRRFVTSMVHLMFTALTGQQPLRAPTDPTASDYKVRLSVFLQQDAFFRNIGDAFIEDGYNLKSIIRWLVLSPYFRAENLVETPGGQNKTAWVVLDEVGMGRLLTPEQLGRRITAVTGSPWIDPATGEDALRGDFLSYYGGIDSKHLTRRMGELNGMMANVAERMANEVACASLSDFDLEAPERRLFPHVEWDFAPQEKHGFEVPEMVSAIRQNIQHLHQRVLGERLELADPEIDRTYALFLAVWSKGRQGVIDGVYGATLPEDCAVDSIAGDADYTARAWMAVLSYLLSDYRFLYE